MQSLPNRSENRGRLPRYDAFLLSITERCHVGCGHCGFIGARRDRESSLDEVYNWTDQIANYGGIQRLILTGGEPFERIEALEAAVATARGRIPIISIFTSSFWASSKNEAIQILGRLPGLRQLYLSSDPYHQKRVPYEYVHNAIEAALVLGIEYLTICITYGNDKELAEVKENYVRWGSRLVFHEDRVIPTPFLSKKVLARQAAGITIDPEKYSRTCYLQTPLINPNGEVYACHSGKAAVHRNLRESPFYLGDLRKNRLIDIADQAARRWDYQFMRTLGPKGVASVMHDATHAIDKNDFARKNEFTSACDMCFSTLKTSSGQAALGKRLTNPDVKEMINIRLAVGLGEDPMEM